MPDLAALNSKTPRSQPKLTPELQTVKTPLKLEAWREALSNHPDRGFVQYILDGMHNGFRIGFDYTACTTTAVKSNMLSAIQHAATVNEYLQRECSEGRMLGRALVSSTGTLGASEPIRSDSKKESTG